MWKPALVSVLLVACGDGHAEQRQACASAHRTLAVTLSPVLAPSSSHLDEDDVREIADYRRRSRRGTPLSAGVPVSGEPLSDDATEDQRGRRTERQAAHQPALAYVEARNAFGAAIDALADAQRGAHAALGPAPDPTQAVDLPAARRALDAVGAATTAFRSAEARHVETARAFLTAIWPVLLRGYREILEQLEWVAEGWARNPEDGSPLMTMMGLRLTLASAGHQLDAELEKEALRLVEEDWSERTEVSSDSDVEHGTGSSLSPYGRRSHVALRGAALDARRTEVRWRIARLQELGSRPPTSLLRSPWRPDLESMDRVRTSFTTSCANLPPP